MQVFQLNQLDTTAIVNGSARSFLVSDLQNVQEGDEVTLVGSCLTANHPYSATIKAYVVHTRLFAFPAPVGYRYLIDFLLITCSKTPKS